MFQWRKKINGHIQTCSNEKTLVKMVDLGPDWDCCESESQTKSQTGTNIETKVSLEGEIKGKGGVEPPESSVQPPMTKCVILILLNKGLQVSEKLKTTKMLNQSHQVSIISRELLKRQRMNKSFLFRKKLKKNKMLTKSHQLRKFRKK